MIGVYSNRESIISLWHNVFGDEREEIEFFLDNCKNKKCIAYYNNDKLFSMLFVVDCLCNKENCKYIYAACTAQNQRGNGYMSKLIKFVQDGNERVCLIPANKDLITYYSDRKFNYFANIEDIIFNENKEICEYLFDGCELSNPIVMVYKGE